jgi:hypothetical protein
MVSRTAPDAFDIWDDVEGVFVPRLNSPNERLWNDRFWAQSGHSTKRQVQKRTLAAAEDGLYVIALWIGHEARVVTSQVTFSGIAKPWRTDIGSARFLGQAE